MSKLMFSVICMTHVLELSIQLDKHQPDKSRKHWRCAQQWNSSINEEQLIVIVIGFCSQSRLLTSYIVIQIACH